MPTAQPRPTLPGVASWARKPGALVLVPAWTLSLASVPFALFIVVLTFWFDVKPSDLLSVSSTVVSALLLLLG
jgi:hypothetical protein